MNRRTALASAAAISLSLTGIAVAAGATMHVFQAADASPNIGKVSPVSTTTQPAEIEHHVLDVNDLPAPPVADPVATPAPSSGEDHDGSGEVHRSSTPAPAPTPVAADHHAQPDHEHEAAPDTDDD